MQQNLSTPIRATTQDFTEIEDILDNLVLLKDGTTTMVLETSATNFGLLSAEEQDALVYAYASLINSLSFPLQIIVMSKRMDISTYIDRITKRENSAKDLVIKDRLRSYKEFILSIVKENRVLEKKFYLCISFTPLEMGVKGAFGQSGKNKKLPYPKEYIISRAKTALYPKRDHLLRQLVRIGLKGKELTTQELVGFFYNIYNPSFLGVRLDQPEGYKAALVEGKTHINRL